MPTFVIGSTWRTKARFKVAGVLTDPTTVTLNIKVPVGTETAYTYGAAEITKEATGLYYKDIVITTAGRHVARWEGSGTVPDAVEHYIDVPPSFFASP